MKLLIKIDVTKINKNKIIPRIFTNQNGEEITAKDYQIEAIPLKEEKIIKDGSDWQMVKTHFIVESQTKEERENKIKTPILGDGIQFKSKNTTLDTQDSNPEEEINPDDIPF